MNTKKYAKHGLIAAFLYTTSPIIQVGVVDRAHATFDSITTGQNMMDMKTPYLMEDAILAYAVYSDGFNVSDSFNFWKAKLSSTKESCLSPDDLNKYQGAVTSALNDKARCLSELANVDFEVLAPKPEDGWDYCNFLEEEGTPHTKDTSWESRPYICTPIEQ